ncbi:diguanylate cyclase domain-containing protein [Modestobacter sp. SYSU DS0875]
MNDHRGPQLRLPVLLTLAGLAVTLPFSPAGALPQWDDVVLAVFGSWAAWHCARLTGAMQRRDRLPWQVLGVSALLYAAASVLAAAGNGASADGLRPADAFMLLAALGPLVSAALIGGRVRGARWPILVVDGLTVTVALVIVGDVLVLSPALAPGALAPHLQPVVLAYGLYPAVAIGVVGALCTVSSEAVHRSATAIIQMTGLIGLASALVAAEFLVPAGALVAVSDVAVLLALATGLRAVALAPAGPAPTDPAASIEPVPRVNAAGVAIVVLALVGVPVTLLLAVVLELPIGAGEVICTAVLILLLLVRTALRIRESGRMAQELVRTEEDFRGLVEASSDGVAIVGADLRLEFTSPAARTLLGLSDAAPHPLLLDLLPEEDRACVARELTAVVDDVAPPLHLRVLPAGGEPRDLEVTHHERPGSGRRVLHLRDVTTRRRRERELERMAFTDHLTRLRNRAMLFQEMASPATGDRSLLVLDLDGFKAVNDSAGHEAGDLLLVEVARRLEGLVRADDLVARLGGDEFAVLLAGDEDAATEAAQRVVDVLARPYRVGGRTFSVGASVGLSRVHPGGGQLAFRQADAALRAAKQAGKGCWRVHSEDRVSQATATSSIAAALADGDVQLRFDTIANGDTGILAALHAQPVWVHPELGVLPAAELWAAAERQGQTAALQRWLLTRACADVAALDDQLLVAVDLPAGLVHAEELPGEVAAALAAAGLTPPRLTLFVTEDVLQTSSAALIPALHTVQRTGVRLGLDDYGMGSTLWAQLARLPLEVVMVDVRNLWAGGDRDRTLELLGAIGRSARGFEVSTVAKEITSRQLLSELRRQGEVAVAGPVLPSGLTAAQVATLLRHPSSAVVAPLPAPRPRAEVW